MTRRSEVDSVMNDADMEIIVVLGVTGQTARVRLPDTSEEQWPLTSLPQGVQPGDRVGITGEGGTQECHLLPRLGGLMA
jgi:hypothetical protein